MKILGLDLAHLPIFVIGGSLGVAFSSQLPVSWQIPGISIPIGAFFIVLWPIFLFTTLQIIAFRFPRGYLLQRIEQVFRPKKYTPFRTSR